MGFLTTLFEPRGSTFMDLLLSSRGEGMETATGRKITALGSLQSTAVFGAVRILAESVASLPLILYQRSEVGKSRAEGHRLYSLLHDLPNPEMTSVELRETLMGHLPLWGNAYAEIQRDRGGRVLALWPLRPDRVDVQRYNGELIYTVTIGDPLEYNPEQQVLGFRNVMHLKGLGYDGVKGYSPIAMARQAIGLTLATEEFGARFFGNGARPGAVLEHPGHLTEGAQERLKKAWASRHQGLSQAHRIAILEEGMKLHEIGIPPEDAQFLETRKFQVTEIARLFRVPPHMLADLERATFSNIEHQSIEFVMHSLRPWLIRWEQAISRDLLSVSERATYYAKHLIEALLRGDIKTRYEAYAIARMNGWLSANDIREMEDQNRIDGGDVYLVPLNMMPADQVGAGFNHPTDDPPLSDDPDTRLLGPGRESRDGAFVELRAKQTAVGRQRLAGSYERLLADVAGRVVRREVNDVRRAVRKFLGKRTAAEFREWLETFYADHQDFLAAQFLPILLSYAEQIGLAVDTELNIEAQDPEQVRQFIDDYVTTLAAREASSGLNQLRALLESALEAEEDPEAEINTRLDQWAETKPDKLARNETTRAGNAFAKAFYVLAGVQFLRWVAIGENCAYCNELNGRVMGITQTFLPRDTDFEPEGAKSPIRVRSDISHPPLHRGCDCTIVASA